MITDGAAGEAGVALAENKDGTTDGDVRYFICSRYLSGKRFA